MKTPTFHLGPTGFRTLIGLACAAAILLPAAAQERLSDKPTSAEKSAKRAAWRANRKKAPKYEYVEVTGSRIRYRVKAGEGGRSIPLHITVMDPKETANQGYPGTMDMLSRNPAITPGYRGH